LPTLPNGISYTYFKRGYADGSDDGGPWVRVQALVKWAERFRFVNGMRSTVTITGPVGAGGVVWARPMPYPDSPNLFAFEVSMVDAIGQPRENSAGGFECDHALYEVVYRRPPFDLSGTDVANSIGPRSFPYMSFRRRTSIEVERIPGLGLTWEDPTDYPAGTTAALDKDFPVSVPVTEMVFTRHMLPYMPTAAIDDFAGCVNAAVFCDYPEGQVQFQGISADRQIDGGSGETVNEIEMTFLRKPRDWNTAWSEIPGRGWRRVWSDPTNQLRPYPYADFDALFGLA
jgi:hypothetical protein